MIVFGVIFACFKIPDILLKVENYEIQGNICDNKKRDIDFEVEEIYLVRAIYDIESENNSVLISGATMEKVVEFSYKNTENKNDILQEILNLQKYNIIKGVNIKDNSKVTIGIMDKIYKKNDDEYIVKNISLEGNNIKCEFDIESKSGKIISIFFDKKNLGSKQNSQKIFMNYINYLGLDIIDDWTFQNSMIKSKNAKLVVSLVQSDNFCLLSIHSNDKLSNTGNLYNYVTK